MTTVLYTDDLSVHPAAIGHCVIRSTGAILSHSDTIEEAEQAKRAFENVLAPRFTRDEAIAIVKAAIEAHYRNGPDGWPEIAATARVVLEALAAAGVFSDGVPIPGDIDAGEHYAAAMSAKLDAAGIR